MTHPEFYDKIRELSEQYDRLAQQQEDITAQKQRICDDFAKSVTQEYCSLIGKKVCVHYKRHNKACEVIGYLHGFAASVRYNRAEIHPVMAKTKQDGSEAKVMYSYLCVGELKEIVSIDEVIDRR